MLPFELTKDTPYLALSGELWSVFYEYFNRNWPCYKGFLLYHTVEWWTYEKVKMLLAFYVLILLSADQFYQHLTHFSPCYKTQTFLKDMDISIEVAYSDVDS